MLLEPLGTVSASITQAADVLIPSAPLGFLLVLLTAFDTRRKAACLADPAVSFIMQRILAESTWRLRSFARHAFAARLLAFVAGPCLKSGFRVDGPFFPVAIREVCTHNSATSRVLVLVAVVDSVDEGVVLDGILWAPLLQHRVIGLHTEFAERILTIIGPSQ